MRQTGFWKDIPLEDMSPTQWESLCDGCAKCCVLKLEDIDTGDIHYTDVGCKLLDCDTARCTNYQNRKTLVPDCVILGPESVRHLSWMPQSCAYRLVKDGKDLPSWHPLITGKDNSAHLAGESVAGRIISETEVDDEDMPNHIKVW